MSKSMIGQITQPVLPESYTYGIVLTLVNFTLNMAQVRFIK